MNFNLSSTIALFGAVGIAATSVIGTPTSAQAGVLSISGAPVTAVATGLQDPSGNYITTFDFGKFGSGPNPVGTGQFLVTAGDGIFSAYDPLPFTVGTIKDVPPFPAPIGTTVANFLQLPGTSFDLQSIDSVAYTYTNNGVNVSFGVTGLFLYNQGIKHKGFGTFGAEITFPVNGISNKAQFEKFLKTQGASITIQSWSANLTDVPEPLTMLGAGAALGFGGFFKRKLANKQEK
nr:PEP-CTERM sorting domain-containing protein [Gloeothece verrucosa]